MLLTQSIFYLVLLSFIIVSSSIYFRYQKRIKKFQDYLHINQSIGIAPLAIAMISMSLSAAFLRSSIVNVQTYGIGSSVARTLFYTITPLILGDAIFPQLLTFPNTYSLGGVIRHMYGRVAGTITSFITALLVGYLAYYQLITLVDTVPIFHKNQQLFLVLAGIVAVFQAIWISNSTISTIAILQFIIITGLLFSLATIVLALPVVIKNGGGLQGLLEAIKNQATTRQAILLSYQPRLGSLLNFLNVFFIFLHPPLMQRILIVKDNRQVKNAFRSFALFHICFQFFVTIIGLGAVLINLKKYGIFLTKFDIATASISTSGWVGLSYSYLVLISSVTIVGYFLHSLAVELSQNIIKPFYAYKGKPLRYDNNIIQLIILMTGSLCVLLAFINTQTYIHAFLPLTIFTPAILAPFLIGCTGLQSNSRIFIIGVITFYITTLMLGWAARHGYFPIKAGLHLGRQFARLQPFAILASGIAVLAAHYWTYGRWNKRKTLYTRLQLKKNKEDSFRAIVSNPLIWAKSKLEKYDHQPTAVGAFLLFTLSFPMLAGNNTFKDYDGTFLFAVRIIGIGLATITMLHNLFPYFLKKLFPLLWFFTLGYCIPFCHAFFAMCSPHHTILFFKLGLLLLLLRLLIDWRTFIVLSSTGILAAYASYKVFIPAHIQGLSFEHTWNIIEVIVLVGVIILGFMRYQEEVNSNHIRRSKTLASGFSHDLRNVLQYTNWLLDNPLHDESMKQIVQNKWENLKEANQAREKLAKSIDAVKQHLQECEGEANVFYQLVKNEYIKPKDIEKVSIRALIENSYYFIPNEDKSKVKIVVTKDTMVIVHPTIIRSAIINLVKNGFWHGQAEQIIIGWDHTKKQLYIQDNGVGIPPEKQPYIFDLYYSSNGSGVGLPFIKITLQKTNADIFYTTSPKGTTMLIPLPTEKS